MRVHCEKPGDGQLRVTFSFDPADVRLEQTLIGVVVHLRDCRTTGTPGSPALPKYDARIALPARTRMTGIEMRTVATTPVSSEAVPVAPLQFLRPGSSYDRPDEKQELTVEPYPNPPFVPANPVQYEEAMRRPVARVLNATVEGLNPVVAVELNPVRLTTDARLELQSEIEIVVRFENDDTLGDKPSHIHSRAQAQRDVALTKRTVINREVVFDYSDRYPFLMTGADYLVITDNRRWDPVAMTAGADAGGDLVASFRRLAQWKRQRGLRARVVTVTDIVGDRYGNFRSGSRDLQEVIRRFLKMAYSDWGVAWVLLGGDTGIIPVRAVAGAVGGGIGKQATDPPPDNTMVWSGNHMRMHVLAPWWGFAHSAMNLLVRFDTGMLIPYDTAGTSGTTTRGWYFTTDNTYSVRSTTATEFIRVNGPASEVNGDMLQFLYAWNVIPTDLYYSSLVGPQYDQPGRHDWDLLDNGVYGQHSNGELDGVNYTPTLSLGRAPVGNAAEADVFVNKVIAYEKYERPDGTALDSDWPRRVLLVSENWGGRIGIGPSMNTPPDDNTYLHVAGEPHTIIKLKDTPDYNWSLLAVVSEADVRELPYRDDAASAGRGWYFATSATNLNPAALHIPIPGGSVVTLPLISNWIAVFGTAEELAPAGWYLFNHVGDDGSLHDQEQLRQQIGSQMPGFNSFRRLYEDIQDMTPAQVSAAPLELITTARLRDELDRGPHIVSLSGHGYWGGCCKLGYEVADTAANGYHTFIAYADSCLTNQFEGDAMSEHLLRNANGGAVAYVGSTRFSWIGVGDDIQRRFFQEWSSLAGDAHLGLLFDTRALTYPDLYGAYGRWSVLALNLMGDPEMPLWWAQPFKLRIPDLVLIDVFKLLLDEPDPPEPWFEEPYAKNWTQTFVHLRQGDVERLALADANGRVEIPLTEFRSGAATVTISRPGHQPAVKDVTLTKSLDARPGCLGRLMRLLR